MSRWIDNSKKRFGLVRQARQRDTLPAALWDRTDALAASGLFAMFHATITGE